MPAERHQGEVSLKRRWRQGAGKAGLDEPRTDRVDGDAVAAHFAGERTGEAEQPSLGSGIARGPGTTEKSRR